MIKNGKTTLKQTNRSATAVLLRIFQIDERDNRNMNQVKLFCDIESNIQTLESNINTCLADHPDISNVRITGNIAPQTMTASSQKVGALGGQRFASSDIVVIIQYEKD